ncbi:MAG: hypothetical protein KAT38_11080 [Bacteroidales bacterium]|nr:hypothetical protein [Bacteroidales bacterium]
MLIPAIFTIFASFSEKSEPKNRKQESGIRNRGIRNRESGIRNQESGTLNLEP